MSTYKILIVEDESIAALALKESLEEYGCQVSGTAASAEETLSLLGKEIPDLLLMDINLQEKEDGIQLGEKVMRKYDVPVVFLSAYADRATVLRAKEVFPYGYMVKPYAEPELFAVIETAIHKHQADKKERELHQLKDKFYSIVAHDLRSPLAALAFTTRLLNRKVDELPKEQLKEFIGEIHATVENINQFTENLLEWSRSQSGRLQVYPETIPVAAILEEVFALLKGPASKKNIRLQANVRSEQVLADKNMLRSVLLNLIQNSIKFTHPHSSVEVEAGKEGNFTFVVVRDYGVGMNEQQITNLFDFNANSHTLGTNEEKGTGLGLLLCKEFIEANGGEITVKSEENKGTEFRFTLPAAAE